MSTQRPLGLQVAVFFLRIARSGSRRQILSGDQRCSAEDERESCADRLDGCYIRDFADPHRIIKTPNTLKKPYRVTEFPGYENVLLPYLVLQEIIREEEPTWKTALQHSKGIYLITDTKNGKHYVGAAYGDEALWNRWSSYAANGHGNNRELRQLIEKSGINYAEYFQFSILEIRSTTTDDQEIIKRETHWKQMLKSREFGYNDN